MNNPLVSIIVPVYNVEGYLPRCLDSIKAQNYTDFEVILIDDGSTDSSGAICDEYVAKDLRFHVFHQLNKGVSSARNVGLKNMTGEWCTFVDSDDLLLPTTLETYIHYISEDIDSIVAGYKMIDQDNQILRESNIRLSHKISYETALKDFYDSQLGMFNSYIWDRLFRCSVIHNHHIRFNEHIHIKEDGLFIVDFLCASKRNVYQTSDVVYFYVQNEASVMNRLVSSYNPNYFSDIDACTLCYRQIKENTTDKELHKMSKDYIFTVHQHVRHHLQNHKIRNIKPWWKLFNKTIKGTSLWFVIISYFKMIKKMLYSNNK